MHVHTQINVWLFISRDTWVCDWTAELRLFRDKQRDPPPHVSASHIAHHKLQTDDSSKAEEKHLNCSAVLTAINLNDFSLINERMINNVAACFHLHFDEVMFD